MHNCIKAINWTQTAWHLVVVATDASFHSAGEGRLAGIFTPNDGLCHLDSNGAGGRYTYATEQDYPSVSQIRKVLHDNRISPIFAVTSDWKYLYKNLTQALIPVTSFVGILANDSSNIPSLIISGYEEIASQIFLTAVTEDNIKAEVEIISCGDNDTDAEVISSRQGCKGVEEGEMALFSVSIELADCSTSEPFNLTLNAGAYGQTVVTVRPICSCSCEEQAVYNASECNGHGTLECGACICYSSWTGTHCQCNTESLPTSACKLGGSNDEPDCSGNGQCVCDTCECDVRANGKPLWFGQYCQCRQQNCPVDITGAECGGPERGECVCDSNCICKCHCNGGWRSDKDNSACECVPPSDSNCDNGGTECSGNGNCSCSGECECDGGYFGTYCETCIDCPDICADNNIEECVACEKAETNCKVDCSFNITILSSKQEDDYQIRYNGTAYTNRCKIIKLY
jgi:protocadherin alpha